MQRTWTTVSHNWYWPFHIYGLNWEAGFGFRYYDRFHCQRLGKLQRLDPTGIEPTRLFHILGYLINQSPGLGMHGLDLGLMTRR